MSTADNSDHTLGNYLLLALSEDEGERADSENAAEGETFFLKDREDDAAFDSNTETIEKLEV